MSNELAVTSHDDLALLQKPDDQGVFGSIVKATPFFPRLTLQIGSSDLCKKKKFPVDHYALFLSKDPIDMGETVDIIPLIWRAKALDMTDENNIINCFDANSDEFKRITAEANIKKQDNKCRYGLEWLVWVPAQKTFAVVFFGNVSTRRLSNDFKKLAGNGVTMSSELIETSNYSWQNPKIQICSTELLRYTQEELKAAAELFNNPPAQQIEKAPEEAAAAESIR